MTIIKKSQNTQFYLFFIYLLKQATKMTQKLPSNCFIDLNRYLDVRFSLCMGGLLKSQIRTFCKKVKFLLHLA